jgi:hypothetical protein
MQWREMTCRAPARSALGDWTDQTPDSVLSEGTKRSTSMHMHKTSVQRRGIVDILRDGVVGAFLDFIDSLS